MREPTIVILLFCYSLGLLGPVLPLLDYAMRYDYYAQVLCENRDKPELKCNGTCKLAQLMKASEEAHQAIPNSSKTMEAPVLMVLFTPEPSLNIIPETREIANSQGFEFSEIVQNQWLPSPPVPPPWS